MLNPHTPLDGPLCIGVIVQVLLDSGYLRVSRKYGHIARPDSPNMPRGGAFCSRRVTTSDVLVVPGLAEYIEASSSSDRDVFTPAHPRLPEVLAALGPVRPRSRRHP